MIFIDPSEFNKGTKGKICSVRLSENEIEAIERLRMKRWRESNTNLTFGATLREIIASYNWSEVE